MKIIARFAAFVMSALVMFSACQKQQTSLSLEDITQKATVSGTVVYPNSYELADDNTVKLTTTPADSATVIVKVSTSSFSNSDNYLTFTTYTNSKGEYSVEVPAVDAGTDVYVQVVSFNGTQKYLKEVVGGELVWDVKTGVYSAWEEGLTVYPGEKVTQNIVYEFTEQNLDPDGTVDGLARIMGTLTYDAGQTWSASEGFTELILPAAKVQIIVNANGNEFSVITDEKGHYDFTLPANYYYEVTLTPQSFMGTYSELKDVENGEYVFDTKECIYYVSSDFVYAYNGAIETLDFEYYHNTIDAVETLDEKLPLMIKVGMGVPSGIKYELDSYTKTWQKNETISGETYKVYKISESPYNYSYEGTVKAAKGVDVIVTVYYDDLGERKYGATTDSNGDITLEIPAYDKVWNPTIEIEAQGFVHKEPFVYYLPTSTYIEDEERREVVDEDKEVLMIKTLEVESATIPAGNGIYTQYSSSYWDVEWTEFEEFVPYVKLLMTYDLEIEDADVSGEYDSYLQSKLNNSYLQYFNDKF